MNERQQEIPDAPGPRPIAIRLTGLAIRAVALALVVPMLWGAIFFCYPPVRLLDLNVWWLTGLSAAAAAAHVEFFRRMKTELSPKWRSRFPRLAAEIFSLKEAAQFAGVVFCFYWLAFFVTHTVEMNFVDGTRVKDDSAESTLRRYAGAQEAFSRWAAANPDKAAGLTRATGQTVYADNFRNLHYGFSEERYYPPYASNPAYEGQTNHFLGWLGEWDADAFLYDNALGGAPTVSPEARPTPNVDAAYYFQEDPSGALPATAYGDGFALMAFPKQLGITGNYVFWVGNGTGVYRQRPDAPKGTHARELYALYRGKPGTTPASGSFASWERLYWLPERNELIWRPTLAVAIVLGLVFQGTGLETSLRFRRKRPELFSSMPRIKYICFIITAAWFLFMGPALLFSLFS